MGGQNMGLENETSPRLFEAVSMKIGGVTFILSLLLAILSGCSPDAPPGVEKEKVGGAGVAAGPGTPTKGGTYVMAYHGPRHAWTLSPFWDGFGHQIVINQFHYNTLAELDEDMQRFVPGLAERWEISEDGLEVTFHLRRDVKWQDGQPFTAEDVVFTVRAWFLVADAYVDEPILTLLKGARAYYEGVTEELAAVAALDRHTVRFAFAQPSPLFMDELNRRPMMPKHLLEGKIRRGMSLADAGALDFARKPVGTGPFKVVDYKADEYIIYEKNPHYFRGEPYLDKLIVRLVSSETPIATGLETGEIHAAVMWNKEHFPRLFSLDHLTAWEDSIAFGSFSLMPNLRPERKGHPLHDVRFRKAILYAIPRKKIAENLRVISRGVPNQVYSPRFLEGLPLTDYSYDPEKARELLAEMGYDPEGAPELILAHLIFDKSPEQPAMQQALAEVGIQVKLLAVETAGAISLVANAEGWDLFQKYSPQYPDAGWVVSDMLRCPGPPWEACGWGAMHTWKPPPRYAEIEKLQRQELDPEKRKALLQEAILILDEEVPTLPLWTEPNVYFINKRVHGMHKGVYKYGGRVQIYVGAETWWVEPEN